MPRISRDLIGTCGLLLWARGASIRSCRIPSCDCSRTIRMSLRSLRRILLLGIRPVRFAYCCGNTGSQPWQKNVKQECGGAGDFWACTPPHWSGQLRATLRLSNGLLCSRGTNSWPRICTSPEQGSRVICSEPQGMCRGLRPKWPGSGYCPGPGRTAGRCA